MTPLAPPVVDQPLTVVATGFGFVEAPSFDRAGALVFSDVRAGRVHRLPGAAHAGRAREGPAHTGTDAIEVFHEVASAWCNGTAFHRDGRLFLCDVGAGAILAIAPNGTATVFADHYSDGERLRGPNDLVFDRAGVLYFTDPQGSSLEQPVGTVCRATADGRVERIAGDFAFPNGLALTAAEDALIVAETRTRRLYRLDLGAAGLVGPRELFCQLPEDGVGPDGMALAASGDLYVCHIGAGCIDVVSPEGVVRHRILTGGERPSNCTFHGESLYVTVIHQDVGAIHRLDVGVAGHPLYAERKDTKDTT